MALFGLGIATAIQGGSIALDTTDAPAAAPSQLVYHVPPPSQVPAASSDATQQDTVTLSGTAPSTGSSANSNGYVQVAAFTLLAQEFTFPPDASGEGASGATAVVANSTSDAAPADQTAPSQQQRSAPLLTLESANANAIPVAAASGQTSTDAALANAGTSAADSATASRSSVTAPQETLQQLDQELQRLGINPQDISLMNRMALLFWVNDPAALRQFVQGMQPSAANSQPNGTEVSLGVQSQNQSQNQTQPTTQNQSPATLPGANQNSDSTQVSNIVGANPSNAMLLQNSTAALQFQQLQVSLAVVGQDPQAAFARTAGSSTQGQFLNISA
jgi:Cu/Ag efflux protein CusF